MSIKKGRQMGVNLADIRADHIARYEEAVRVGERVSASKVADLGAGFGYGSYMLAQSFDVMSYDIDPDVIPFAEEHWKHPRIKRGTIDLSKQVPAPADLFVAFEVLEHFHCTDFLKRALELTPYFLGSVPNQDVVPFGGPSVHPQHVRHYTPQELVDLMEDCGWVVRNLGCQADKRGPGALVRWGWVAGRTLIFLAERA